jgi:hypothetical protein
MDDTATLALLLDRVVDGREVCPDAETTAAILEGAGRFAERHLALLPVAADRQGCRLRRGACGRPRAMPRLGVPTARPDGPG